MKALPFVITDLNVKTVFVLSIYHKMLEFQKCNCGIVAAKNHIDSMIKAAMQSNHQMRHRPYHTELINNTILKVTFDGDVVLSITTKHIVTPNTINIPNRIRA